VAFSIIFKENTYLEVTSHRKGITRTARLEEFQSSSAVSVGKGSMKSGDNIRNQLLANRLTEIVYLK